MLFNFCHVLIFVDVQCGLFVCMFYVIEYIICNLFNVFCWGGGGGRGGGRRTDVRANKKNPIIYLLIFVLMIYMKSSYMYIFFFLGGGGRRADVRANKKQYVFPYFCAYDLYEKFKLLAQDVL